jgi:hypothetical protein
MKKRLFGPLSPFLLSGTLCASGQGSFLFDQQSSANETPTPGAGITIQTIAAPYGQSFTPLLTGIGFVRLNLDDKQPGNGVGATLYVNLRSDSIGGPILSASTPISLLDGFAGPATFFFPTEVPLTPGTAYFFQPVVQAHGDLWGVLGGEGFDYPGGYMWRGGQAVFQSDYWFREGIVVPEPHAMVLIPLAFILLARMHSPKKA